MKAKPVENQYGKFTSLVDQVLAVPRSEIERRIEDHRKQTAENPNRRGPKTKRPS